MSYVILLQDKPKKYYSDNFREFAPINIAHKFTILEIIVNIKTILYHKLKVFKIKKNGKIVRFL
jgi:hypothetical protein